MSQERLQAAHPHRMTGMILRLIYIVNTFCGTSFINWVLTKFYSRATLPFMKCPYKHCNGTKLDKESRCKTCGRKVGIQVNSDNVEEAVTRGRPSRDLVMNSFRIPYYVSEWLRGLPKGEQAQVVNNALIRAHDELA